MLLWLPAEPPRTDSTHPPHTACPHSSMRAWWRGSCDENGRSHVPHAKSGERVARESDTVEGAGGGVNDAARREGAAGAAVGAWSGMAMAAH